jgi:hypothetical protein
MRTKLFEKIICRKNVSPKHLRDMSSSVSFKIYLILQVREK